MPRWTATRAFIAYHRAMDTFPPGFAYDRNLARVVSIDGEAVQMAFDAAEGGWPWLALPGWHPVLLEKYQYFGGSTGLMALGGAEPGFGGALTECQWQVDVDALQRPAETGVCRMGGEPPRFAFVLELAGEAGTTACRYTGAGVRLPLEEFLARRAASRDRALAACSDATFAAAPAASVGAGFDGVSLVSPVEYAGGLARCTALVTLAGGFHPRHPFHTGSGDHVNVGHMLDCAFQLAHQLVGQGGALACVGGECRFRRFVELDVPFELVCEPWSANGDGAQRGARELPIAVRQLGRDCAQLTLRVVPLGDESRPGTAEAWGVEIGAGPAAMSLLGAATGTPGKS